MHDQKEFSMQEFEDVLAQYEPMISHSIRKLNIYRDHEQYRQVGRIALWQAWKRFDTEKGDFTPFAYRSIRGAMLDELKREARYEERFLPAVNEVIIDHLGAEVEEAYHLLHDAIGQLDPREKAFIQWSFVEQYSLAECAELAGISVAGVKKRRERMMRKLKKMMKAASQ
ncbi:sigma-70 family RNA polymerase sigma factor [Sporosarcina luteola]|uniref:sigma-70 family RNA polymerase sigma factor n=1 Tax=Sporosarcina luteola TaxID=582850 RepID=UPI00203C6862|nr:sigma-70 family RNA polymerase sigma factor [Sporosarcina luteola]MCM3636584.1 sigma-70 family RNA polymerase sigma factor [Sporosarcina luteola]